MSDFYSVMEKNFDSVPAILVCGCDLCGLETGVVIRVAVQHEIGGLRRWNVITHVDGTARPGAPYARRSCSSVVLFRRRST